MRNTLVQLGVLLLAFETARAGVDPVAVEDVKTYRKGKQGLGVQITLKYEGGEDLRHTLIDGRYLLIHRFYTSLMEDDIFMDDQLWSPSAPEDTYEPPLTKETQNGAPGRLLWDVVSHPTLQITRLYQVADKSLARVEQYWFEHEIIAGEPSWLGRLNRLNMPQSTPMGEDEKPIAALVVGDAIWQVFRMILHAGRLTAKHFAGKSALSPETLSDPEVYFIVDIRLRNRVGDLVSRKVLKLETVEPPASGALDGDETRSIPGYEDLSQPR